MVAASEIARPVLDVHQGAEFEAGHRPGARPVEPGALPMDIDELGDVDSVIVICGHDERAMTRASLLVGAGPRDVAVAVGGPDDWAAAHDQPLHSRR